MSTKIYNGYYIDKCTLDELQAFSMSVRATMLPVFNKLYATKVIKEAIELMDTKALLEAGLYVRNDIEKETRKAIDNINRSLLTSAKFGVDDRSYAIEKTGIRDPDYDFECKIWVIPIADKILAIVNTEQPDLQKVFESFPNVHDYRYWNNNERAEKLSEEEWGQRKTDWDVIVHTASIVGFCLHCTPPYLPWLNREELYSTAEHPTYEKRVCRHTFNILFKQFVEENHKTEVRMSDWVHLIDGTHEWIKSEAGRQKKAEAEAKVRAVLKENIIMEDLAHEE